LAGVVDSNTVTRNVKKPVDRLKDVLSTDQIKKATIFETAEDPIAILHLCELDKYRQAYRRFRVKCLFVLLNEILYTKPTFSIVFFLVFFFITVLGTLILGILVIICLSLYLILFLND
jgi:hypothetical protein